MDPTNEIVQNNREETLPPEPVHAPVYVPGCPEHSHQPSLPMPGFAFGPLVLVPVNEFWFNPYLAPPSLVFLHEVQPNWCPVHNPQPGNPELVSGRAPQQVSEQLNVTAELSGNEQIEEDPKSEEGEPQLQTNDEAKSEFPPGSLTHLEEEELAARAFEEYMAIMDSLDPKVLYHIRFRKSHQLHNKPKIFVVLLWKRTVQCCVHAVKISSKSSGVSDSIQVQHEGGMEKVELEGDSLLEYMEKLCTENFINNVEVALEVEFMNALLSGDPEPNQLPARENQEHKVKPQELPPSADIKINPGTEETSTVESTLNTDYLDSSLISNLEAVDFPPLNQLQQEVNRNNSFEAALDLIPVQRSQTPPANSDSITDAALTATSHFKETQLLISDPPDTKSDTTPNQDGQNPPQSTSSVEPLPTDALTKYSNSVNFKDYNQSLPFLENIFSDDSPTPALEARGNDGSVEEPAARIPTGDQVSEETSMSSSTLTGPKPVDPPASESPTTGVSEANDDLHADLLTITPTLLASPRAQSVLASPPAQIKEPEEQRSPKNIKSSCLEDYPSPVPTNFSSLAESCDPPIDANSIDSVTVDQLIEPLKEVQASPGSELKGTTNEVQTRRNQSPRDQTQEKARPTDESMIERTEEKKPGEGSAKKTAELTPQSDGVVHKKQKRRSYRGKQLFQREESHFKERSQATTTANAAEQFPQIGEVEQHQDLAGQVQTLIVDGGEKCEANHSNLGTEIGTENALLTKMTQEEKVERLESKDEVQTTGSVRITRSQSLTHITEERVQRTTRSLSRTGGKVKRSPKTDTQDDKQKNTTKLTTPPVSIKDKVSGDCSPVPLTKCSLQGPRVRMNTRSQKDSLKGDRSRQESPEGLPSEMKKSPVESCEKNPHVIPALSAKTRQQSKTVASSEGGVMGTETRDFYSLRSKTQSNVSKGTGVQENKEAEATRQPSNPKPSPERTTGVKAEDGGGLALALSPMKRYRHECVAWEEIKAKVNEIISSSPTKRGRWKKRAEVNPRDEVETAFRKPSPPLTRSQRKAKDFLGTPSAHDGGGTRKTTRRPSRRMLPTKYKDFVLLKPNGHKRQAETGKRKKTQRGGKTC
ncbi:hypothetical protein D9C73_026847 [Collichthys lucidus]|uniref:Uncharacterized protein n=1 Tax=Collichthys lucidus TaxID=240159 RepID=A0A4U5VWI5_COLLU|nr:hypothetical protein D9C73_026847 [Collichthys lucidus]